MVWASSAEEAVEKANFTEVGRLTQRVDGVWVGDAGFSLSHMTSMQVEVIPT